MLLEVVIPTYGRPDSLVRLVKSMSAARIPGGLDVEIIVVDNNPRMPVDQAVADVRRASSVQLQYIHERAPGKCRALNRGVEVTRGDLVGFLDDDEEIPPDWYEVASRSFEDDMLDFIGGPYIPRWSQPAPAWLPLTWRGVIGWAELSKERVPYSFSGPGTLLGGNCVVRRGMLLKAGPFNTMLGPRPDLHLTYDDNDMLQRLLVANAAGLYLPELFVYHHIPPERLRRRYFLASAFWEGISRCLYDSIWPCGGPHVAGVPRYLYGKAVRGALSATGVLFSGNAADRLNAVLPMFLLAGYFYGRHLFRSAECPPER